MKKFEWKDQDGRNIQLNIEPIHNDKFIASVYENGKELISNEEATVVYDNWYISKIYVPQRIYLKFGERYLLIKEYNSWENDYRVQKYTRRVVDYLYDNINNIQLKQKIKNLTSYGDEYDVLYSDNIPENILKSISEIKSKDFLPVFGFSCKKEEENDNRVMNSITLTIDIFLGISKDLKKVAKYTYRKIYTDDSYSYFSDSKNFFLGGNAYSWYEEEINEENDIYIFDCIGGDYEDWEDSCLNKDDINIITWEEQLEKFKEAIILRWQTKRNIINNMVKNIYNSIEGLQYDEGLQIIKSYLKSTYVQRIKKFIDLKLHEDADCKEKKSIITLKGKDIRNGRNYDTSYTIAFNHIDKKYGYWIIENRGSELN